MASVEINARYVLTNSLLGKESVLASTNSNDSAIISSNSKIGDAQSWFFSQPTSASYYRLHTVEKGEGYALDIRNYYGDSTMDLRFFAIQDRTGQYWHLDKQDDGSVKLSSEFQPDLYLDVVKDNLQPTLRATDSPGQHWTMSRVGSTPTSSVTTTASVTSVSSSDINSAAATSSTKALTSSNNGLSTGTKGGIAAGVVVGVIAFAIGTVLLYRRLTRERVPKGPLDVNGGRARYQVPA